MNIAVSFQPSKMAALMTGHNTKFITQLFSNIVSVLTPLYKIWVPEPRPSLIGVLVHPRFVKMVIIDSIVPLALYIALVVGARFVGKCITSVGLCEREPIMGI